MEAHQRRRLCFRPAKLAAEHDDIAGSDGEMADRELMQIGRQIMFLDEIAIRHST